MTKQYLINCNDVVEFDTSTKCVTIIDDDAADAIYGDASECDDSADSGIQTIKMWIVAGGCVFWESDNCEYQFLGNCDSIYKWLDEWDGGLAMWANTFGFDYPCGDLVDAGSVAACIVATSGENGGDALTPARDDDGVLVFANGGEALAYIKSHLDWTYDVYAS